MSAARWGLVFLIALGADAGASTPAARAPAAADAEAPANLLGMNISAPLDWEGTRLYADVMRTARSFQTAAGTPAAVDADGWPAEDFKVVVWHGIDRMHGSYALSFRGSARSVSGAFGAHDLSDVRYDPATNTTTARIDYLAKDAAGFELRLTGTRRTPRSPVGSGVTELRLMRPVEPGSARSHPAGTLWHPPILALLRKFQVVRYMDFLATNGSQQQEWRDRPLPAWASFNRMGRERGYGWQGIGAPWEHVVLLANALGSDAWVNIPAKASDDYVRNVALLLRYGSDGVDPYASAQERPVYPPLDPRLRIYVEYSNELWNGAPSFKVQFQHNHDQALAEVAAGASPLAFDGEHGEWALAWRRVAKRGVEISLLFRKVFGDAAMMTRVRPILATQLGDGQGTLTQAVRLLHGYYGNGEGRFVADPRPPSYYFYGGGGSGYYGPDLRAPSLSLETLWESKTMDVRRWTEVLRRDADRIAALGLRRVCYEGGPSLDSTGKSDEVKARAVEDPRMRDAVLAHQEAWSASGGELFVFLTAVGSYAWGFTPDVHRLATPKLEAVDRLREARPAPVTHGTAIPGTIEGNGFAFGSRGWEKPGAGRRRLSAEPSGFAWAAYTFRATTPSRRTLRLRVSGADGARVSVYWDGALVGTRSVGARGPTALTLGPVETGAGLHGLIVGAAEGSFELETVGVD